MSVQEKEKSRFTLTRGDKIVLVFIAAVVFVIIVLSILQRAGLSLINGLLPLQLPVVALIALVGWGVSLLVRRIRNKPVKLVLTLVLVIVAMLVVTVLFTYVSFMANLTTAQRYATRTSPSGARKIVILRILDPDEEHIEARRQARLAEDPASNPEPTLEDYAYIYRAYPSVMNIFYKNNADVEGEVYLAYVENLLPKAEAAETTADAAEMAPDAAAEAADAAAEAGVETANDAVETSAETATDAAVDTADVEETAEAAAEAATEATDPTQAPAETAVPAENQPARAVLSHGQLMIEWLDDEQAVRLFAENPGPEEGGECVLRFPAK